GGESQRLKLVRHLADQGAGTKQNGSAYGNLLIFGEPTTGLHFDDVAMLVKLFQRLVEAGNTLIVIEHNLEVIKCADWVIDLGPEAGDEGGALVAAGTPEAIARIDASYTGRYLRNELGSARDSRAVFGDSPKTPKARLLYDVTDPVDAGLACAAEEPFGESPNGARESRALPGNNHAIRIHGAREHNLKNISLNIPRDKMVI